MLGDQQLGALQEWLQQVIEHHSNQTWFLIGHIKGQFYCNLQIHRLIGPVYVALVFQRRRYMGWFY